MKFFANHMKFGFYLLGRKGYVVLIDFVSHFGPDAVGFVVVGQDAGVENDWFADISNYCDANGIKRLARESFECKQNKVDYCFAVGWRWLINHPSNLIVLHDALLPRYRGFSPLVNMLINGEPEIGVTALMASEEYDRGDIIFQEKAIVHYPIKISDAIQQITPLYSMLIIRIAEKINKNCKIVATQQNEDQASYSLWRDEGDYLIDWSLSAESIKRFVDAVGPPYKGAATYLRSQLVRIHDVEICSDVIVESRNTNLGKTIFFDDGKHVIICGSGLLKIVDIRVEDGAPINSLSFRSKFESNV